MESRKNVIAKFLCVHSQSTLKEKLKTDINCYIARNKHIIEIRNGNKLKINTPMTKDSFYVTKENDKTIIYETLKMSGFIPFRDIRDYNFDTFIDITHNLLIYFNYFVEMKIKILQDVNFLASHIFNFKLNDGEDFGEIVMLYRFLNSAQKTSLDRQATIKQYDIYFQLLKILSTGNNTKNVPNYQCESCEFKNKSIKCQFANIEFFHNLFCNNSTRSIKRKAAAAASTNTSTSTRNNVATATATTTTFNNFGENNNDKKKLMNQFSILSNLNLDLNLQCATAINNLSSL